MKGEMRRKECIKLVITEEEDMHGLNINPTSA